jgi:hypothetical protein
MDDIRFGPCAGNEHFFNFENDFGKDTEVFMEYMDIIGDGGLFNIDRTPNF